MINRNNEKHKIYRVVVLIILSSFLLSSCMTTTDNNSQSQNHNLIYLSLLFPIGYSISYLYHRDQDNKKKERELLNEEANKKLEYLDKKRSLSEYEEFILEYSGQTNYIEKAKYQINRMIDEDYKTAKKINTFESYNFYIDKYRESDFVNDEHIKLCNKGIQNLKEQEKKKEVEEAIKEKWQSSNEYNNLKNKFPKNFLDSNLQVGETAHDFFLGLPLKEENMGEDLFGNKIILKKQIQNIKAYQDIITFEILISKSSDVGLFRFEFKYNSKTNTSILNSLYTESYEDNINELVEGIEAVFYMKTIIPELY